MKTVVIVHRWDGKPTSDWYPWLEKQLVNDGWKVIVPEMPKTESPEIEAWVSHLSSVVSSVDEELFFIGHSIGCQTIIRYLSSQENKAGGAVFVAGFFSLMNLEDAQSEIIARPWIQESIDFEKFRKNTVHTIAILSEDDPFVPFEDNKQKFSKDVGATIVVEHGGHLTEADGAIELPSVLKAISSIG